MNRSYLVDLSLIIVAIIWALNFAVVKTTLQEIDPYSFNALRFIFAAGILYLFLKKRKQSLRFSKEHILPLLGLGLLGNLVYQLLFIFGVKFTFSANAAVMLGTIPIWVALVGHFFTDEKLTRLKTAAILFAFLGVAFILAGGKNEINFGSETFLGDVLCLTAAIAWGVYTILSKKYLKTYTALQFSTLMAIIGFVVLSFIAIPSLTRLDWGRISFAGFSGIVYSGALSVGIAYVIWNNGLVKIGAVRTAAYQNLVPLLGLLFGVFLLNEALSFLQYVGSALVITGIVLARMK